jgi:hypothetical protein
MISATLPFVKDNPRLSRSNKIQVCTNYSSDGRSLEAVYIDYNPADTYSLFLLERVLASSEAVDSYSVYDANGTRVPPFDPEKFPKRV